MQLPAHAEPTPYRRMGCRGRLVAVLLGGLMVVVINLLMRSPAEVTVIVRHLNMDNIRVIGNLADSLHTKVQAFHEYDIPLGVRGDLFWHNTPQGFAAVDSGVFSDSVPVHTLCVLPAGKGNVKAAEFMAAFLSCQHDTALRLPRPSTQKR